MIVNSQHVQKVWKIFAEVDSPDEFDDARKKMWKAYHRTEQEANYEVSEELLDDFMKEVIEFTLIVAIASSVFCAGTLANRTASSSPLPETAVSDRP